ncbi:MAG: hypothetical protein KGL46_12035 [Hyphomicrobiales bacterium]|nr:hypothetical protein [Hyphomicrobiales bacterium]
MRSPPAIVALLTLLAAAIPASAQQDIDRAAPVRQCFSASETRSLIAAHKLADPFAALRAAASAERAEAIGVKLCRTGEIYRYEFDLLRKDGRLLHVQADAATGKPVARPRQGN